MANGIIPGSSRTVAGGEAIPALNPNTPEVLLLSALAGTFGGINKQRQAKQTQQASFLNAVAPALVNQGQLSTIPGTPTQSPINPGSSVPLFPSGGATVADLLPALGGQQGGDLSKLASLPLNQLDEFKTLTDLQQSLAPTPNVSPEKLRRAVDRAVESKGLVATKFEDGKEKFVNVGDVDVSSFALLKGKRFQFDEDKLNEAINRTLSGESTDLTINQAQFLKSMRELIETEGLEEVLSGLKRNGASDEQIELVRIMGRK